MSKQSNHPGHQVKEHASAHEAKVGTSLALSPRLALLRIGSVAGLLTGISYFLFFLAVGYWSDTNPLLPVRNLDNGLLIIGLVFSFWYIKNGRAAGRFQFWEGLFNGFVITVVSAIVGAFLTAYWLESVAPEILQGYIKWSLDMARTMHDQTVQSFTEAGYQAQLKSIAAATATDIVVDILIRKLVVGFIIVPIVAAMMRKTVLK